MVIGGSLDGPTSFTWVDQVIAKLPGVIVVVYKLLDQEPAA